MPAMNEMPMPGGWKMSMAWMRMPGQTWPEMSATFLGMWSLMMAAMMLPSLTPALWRYRETAARVGAVRPVRLTALVGMGYFCVWIAFGMAVFAVGVTLAAIEMQVPRIARALPLATAVAVLIAGALQFTSWKARQLACCRAGYLIAGMLQADAGTAWRRGLRLGVHCCGCCAGLTVLLLAIGLMNLKAMVIVTAAITFERLAPAGERVARAIGALILGAGLILLVQTLGLR